MPKQPPAAARDSDRETRIAAIRAEIAAGTYETREKLQAALAAFLSGEELSENSESSPRQPR